MIVFQLLGEGLIQSLDDPIGQYCNKYKDVEPEPYRDTPITFRHLLSHTSGVPHLSRIWQKGKLRLAFRSGTAMQYSTRGYAILGEVITRVTGKSYKKLVRQYIGEKVGANSFTAGFWFTAPGASVYSSIDDMAKFALGVMDGSYVSNDFLNNEVFVSHGSDRFGEMGLGWYVLRPGSDYVAVYHAGSNGKPRAFIAIRPYDNSAIVLTGRNKHQKGPQDFGELTIGLYDTSIFNP
jgi:CubicO group peptidase (beta-lactamase class C family)